MENCITDIYPNCFLIFCRECWNTCYLQRKWRCSWTLWYFSVSNHQQEYRIQSNWSVD